MRPDRLNLDLSVPEADGLAIHICVNLRFCFPHPKERLPDDDSARYAAELQPVSPDVTLKAGGR
jgi:hypothetical protein